MYIHTYMNVCMYVYMYVCICMYVYIHVHVSTVYRWYASTSTRVDLGRVQVPGTLLPIMFLLSVQSSEEGFEAENIPPLTFSTSLCFSTLVQNVSKSSVKCSSSFSPNTPVLNGPNCSMFSSSSSENSS